MNSKRVGNIGEARVLYELVNLGFPVYQQFGDNELADYIIINNDDLLKLQVKTSSSGNSERVMFDLESRLTSKRNKRTYYSINDVDYFLCYDLNNEKIFVVKNVGNMSGITLRYKKPRNNQSSRVNIAEDFLLTKDSFN